jgi:hypothetical protein
MRFLPLLLAGLVMLAPPAAPVHAQANFPWCSNFADGFGGTNCGFVSYEQCMATVRGSGGFCDKSDMYRPENAATKSAQKPGKSISRKSSTRNSKDIRRTP